MNAGLLWQLVRADFLERVRGGRFLFITAATAALGTLFVPGDGGWRVLTVSGYRGIYNSAWVGASVALATAVFLSLFGFYLVNDAVERDRRTGVGQILAATPVTRTLYILGKAVSNFALLTVLVGVLAAVAAAMQVIRGEAPEIEPWPLLSPFLLVTLPGLAVVAAIAVLFECIRPLRGSLGNVLYFFVWVLCLGAEANVPALDLFGVDLLVDAIRDALLSQADVADGFVLIGVGESVPQTFVWEGITWSAPLVVARLFWIPVAALLTALAIPLFDRFDTPPPARRVAQRQQGLDPSLMAGGSGAPAWLKEGPRERLAFARVPMVLQEVRLLLKETSLWWHVGAALLILLTLTVPEEFMTGVWVAAWLWPVGLWSRLVTKEFASRTEDLVLGAARTVRHQLPAAWLAGVLLALVTGSGAIARLALSQSWPQLAAALVGALFIPSLAVALGAITRSEKPFQVLYVVMWYAGPASGLPVLDFMGIHEVTLQAGMPLYYLVLSLPLLALAALARRRQAYAR